MTLRDVVPRRPDEDIVDWMERNARENGWATTPAAEKPLERIPDGVRLPYRDEIGQDG